MPMHHVTDRLLYTHRDIAQPQLKGIGRTGSRPGKQREKRYIASPGGEVPSMIL